MHNHLLMAALKGTLGGGASGPSDPQFSNVAMLLHGNGTNGAQNSTYVSSASPVLNKIGATVEGSYSPYGSVWSTYFPGGGSNLSLASSTAFGMGTGAFTIECWINMQAINTNIGEIIDMRSSVSATALTLLTDGTGHLAYYDGPNNVTYTDSTPLTVGQWYHIALSRDGSGVWRLFKNGTQVATNTSADNLGSSQPLLIGQATNGSTYGFIGYISNLRVLKGTALYTTSFTPPTSPLTAITNTTFLGLQNSYYVDNSSNAAAITRNGSLAISKINPFGPASTYSPSNGGSAWFDGSTGYLSSSIGTTALAFGTGDFTVECWVNTSNVSNGTMLDTRTSSSNGWFFVFSTANIYFGFNGANYSLTSSAPTNTWLHVVYSRQGTSGRCFVNGVLTNTITDSNNYTAQQLLIGSGYAGFNLVGFMTDVRITKGTALYTAAFTPNTTPLTASTNTTFLYNATSAGIYDSSTQLNWVTTPTVQTSNVQSKFGGNSLYLNGTNGTWMQSTNVPIQWGSNDWTIEGWIYSTVATQNVGIFTQRTTNASYCPIAIALNSSGNWQVGLSTSGTSFDTTIVTTTAPTLNTWGHFAVVRSGTTVTVYWNGAVLLSKTVTGALMSSAIGYGLGCDPMSASASYTFKGYIDDFRITIGKARYTTGFSVPTSAFADTAIGDAYFNNVVSMLHFDTQSGSANSSVAGTFAASLISTTSLTKTGTVSEGAFTPYGANWSNFLPSTSSYFTYGSASSASPGNQTFTFETWVNFETLPTTSGQANAYYFWQKGRTTPANFEMSMGIAFISSGNYALQFQASTDGSTVTTVQSNTITNLNVGTWNHIAFTQVGGSGVVNYWLNGQNIGSSTHNIANNYVGVGTAAIGNNNAGSNLAWSGYLSNMRMVFGSRVYTSTFTPSTAPLAAISGTNLLTCQANRFVDNSTNPWAITVVGSPNVARFNPFGDNATPYNTTVYGGSGQFDGSSGSLVTASNASNMAFGTADFTVECWVYLTAAQSNIMFFLDARTSAVTTSWYFGIGFNGSSGATSQLSWGNNASNVMVDPATTDMPQNTWHHCAYSRKNGVGRLFLNGKVVVSGTDANTYTGGANATIGNRFASSYYLNGYLSDVRVVNGSALYTNTFTPSTTPAAVIANTVLLYKGQGANTVGVYDSAMQQNAQLLGTTAISTTQQQFGAGSLQIATTGGTYTNMVIIPNNNLPVWGTANWTVEGWFYPSALTGNFDGLWGQRATAGNYAPMIVGISNGTFSLLMSSSGSNWDYSTGGGTATPGNWYHVAVVRNGGTVIMYVNGNSVGFASVSTNALMTTTAPFTIGSSAVSQSSTAVSFAGFVQDFRITYGVARYVSNFTSPSSAFPNQ